MPYLSLELFSLPWWIVLGVTANVTTADILDRNVLDVETDVITWVCLLQSLVMHFHGFNFSAQVHWSKGDDCTGLQGSGLDTTDWHRSNTLKKIMKLLNIHFNKSVVNSHTILLSTYSFCKRVQLCVWITESTELCLTKNTIHTSNLVDILEWQTKGLVCGPLGWLNVVEGLNHGGTRSGLVSSLDTPSLEPSHLGTGLQHVVTVPSGDWHEGNCVWVVTDLLDVGGNFLLDFLESVLNYKKSFEFFLIILLE